MSIFSDIDKNRTMILGAYKKLKSFYYYDKTQIHNKIKIAEWENDHQQMQASAYVLAQSLKALDEGVYDEQLKYFLSKVNQIILPKKFKDTANEEEDTISNHPKDKNLESVNFFIDAPLELLILDMIWALFVSKISYDNNIIPQSVYANRIKEHSVFTNGKDLFNDIDFHSNRFFKPYFNQYSKWKNTAFSTLRERYYINQDSLLITLDIRNYYYNVDFDFVNLCMYLNNDPRIEDFKNLTNLLKLIYTDYSNSLLKYRSTSDAKRTILPIGLISSAILANLYLNKFDNNINSLQPLYYGRYVDDIMVILDAAKFDKKRIVNKKNAIVDSLVDTRILRPDGNDYKIIEYENLYLSSEKIKCFYLNHEKSSSLIDIIYEYGSTKVSEYNLQPELPFTGKDADNYFDFQAYKLNDIDGTFKLRDFRMAPNNYYATKCINSLTIASKNINLEDQSNNIFNNFIQKQLEQIFKFFSGTSAIEYKTAWLNVFVLLLINRKYDYAIQFYVQINLEILKLNSDKIKDVRNEQTTFILERVRKQLQEHLNICFATGLACFPQNDKLKLMSDDINWDVVFRLSKSIQNANMFNHHLVSLPLQNYCKNNLLDTVNDFIKDLSKLKYEKSCEQCNGLCKLLNFLDEQKLEFSPRFLHLHEIHLAHFSFTFCAGGNVFKGMLDELFQIYKKYNNIGDFQKTYYEIIEQIEHTTLQDIILTNNKTLVSNQINIALANIYIDEFKHVVPALDNPFNGMSPEFKNEFIGMLFEAKKMGANIIVFPEYYFPFAWSDHLSRFSKEQNILIITGMQYITHNKQAYNYLGMFIPLQGSECIPLFREKNDYAPLEQILLAHKGYKFSNASDSHLRLLKINDVTLSDILCFELTNLNYRSLLKGRIEMLFIPELNKDTNYFSSIVESTSRDLHCFTIQSNTSKYGDSRITAPYDSQHKNIVQIRGGHNNVFLLGRINVDELKSKRNENYLKLKERIHNEFDDEKRFIEDKEKNQKDKYKIKDLPARFNERR